MSVIGKSFCSRDLYSYVRLQAEMAEESGGGPSANDHDSKQCASYLHFNCYTAAYMDRYHRTYLYWA